MEAPGEVEPTAADAPGAIYERIRRQVQLVTPGNSAGLIACAVFLLGALVILLMLELRADVEQILAVGIALAAVNLVAGVVATSTSRRD